MIMVFLGAFLGEIPSSILSSDCAEDQRVIGSILFLLIALLITRTLDVALTMLYLKFQGFLARI